MRSLTEIWGRLHNRRPLFFTITAFVLVAVTLTALSVWWNLLLVQNHRILRDMTIAANRAALSPFGNQASFAALMFIGILLSLVVLSGLLYLFLRLIKTVRLNIAQSQFISAVTHELRSPVTALQLLMDAIRDPNISPEKRSEFERDMSEELQRLRLLVDQVLDTARLEHLSVTDRIPTESIDVRSFLESCLDTVEARVKTSGATIKVSAPVHSVFAKMHRALAASAVCNVIDNAIKYSKGRAEVQISVEVLPKKIRIRISDRGIGFDRRESKKLFRRFYRAKHRAAASQTGTGLGLYFARLALRAQGGNITAVSRGVGLGSTFGIEIEKSGRDEVRMHSEAQK